MGALPAKAMGHDDSGERPVTLPRDAMMEEEGDPKA